MEIIVIIICCSFQSSLGFNNYQLFLYIPHRDTEIDRQAEVGGGGGEAGTPQYDGDQALLSPRVGGRLGPPGYLHPPLARSEQRLSSGGGRGDGCNY